MIKFSFKAQIYNKQIKIKDELSPFYFVTDSDKIQKTRKQYPKNTSEMTVQEYLDCLFCRDSENL